jgi:3-isopropylmalate dehydratase small subunit
VVAKSFARIFYRNSINLRLPPIECDVDAEDGDLVQVDLVEGKIKNLTSGKLYTFAPFSPFALKMLNKGLMGYVKCQK